jgi:hypothetical protein
VKIVSPATRPDLAEAMTAAGHRSAAAFGLATAQLALGKSWAARAGDGTALVVAGLVPAGDGSADAWFVAAPLTRSFLLAVVRFIRLTLAAEAYRPIRVVITTPEGARLARLAGLTDGSSDVLPLRRRRLRSGVGTGRVEPPAGGGGPDAPACGAIAPAGGD